MECIGVICIWESLGSILDAGVESPSLNKALDIQVPVVSCIMPVRREYIVILRFSGPYFAVSQILGGSRQE